MVCLRGRGPFKDAFTINVKCLQLNIASFFEFFILLPFMARSHGWLSTGIDELPWLDWFSPGSTAPPRFVVELDALLVSSQGLRPFQQHGKDWSFDLEEK